jgi:sugar lactone lactonase YvrE
VTTSANAVLFDDMVFPEGPRWHNGELWVSDQHAHKVWAIDPSGAGRVVAELDDMPSGIGFLPGGEAVVVEMRTEKLHLIDSSSQVRGYADLSGRPGWLNDMVVDTQGRAYVGYRQGRYAQPDNVGPDAIALVGTDGTVRFVAEDITSPNGLVITPDGKSLIVASTAARELVAFDVASDGSLSGRRTWAPLDHPPDGICLDEEGAVWVAFPSAAEFARVHEGGDVTDRIPVDGWAIACMLGGEGRRTLFMMVTYATAHELHRLGDPGQDNTSQCRGRIESRSVNVAGAGLP